MLLVIEKAKLLEEGVWSGTVDPDFLALKSNKTQPSGNYTVVIISNPDFRSQEKELRFKSDHANVVNLGAGQEAIFIQGGANPKKALAQVEGEKIKRKTNNLIGIGDEIFSQTLREVSPEIQRAGEAVLGEIRNKFQGDLKAYKQRRFFNSPDNFWGVQVQIRLDMLKFWVRGRPEIFSNPGLEIWLDRPPLYSAFKVKSMNDVDQAISIISNAQKKFR